MTSVSSATGSSSSSPDRASIAQNFDQFLMLLTTQLKNQNPLDPMDTNQFTQQLVSFAGVEQQIKSNESLNTLLASMNASNAMNVLSFVGKSVTAVGTMTELKNGSAKWQITSEKAGTVTVKITNSNGEVVKTSSISVTEGEQDFKWDGKTSSGETAKDGKYTISVEGKDANKQPLNLTTAIQGMVQSVNLTTSPPTLSLGFTTISLDSVKSAGTAN